MPDKFKQALIVVIFRKGSRMECGSYQPISLLSHIYKVFISIIANRINSTAQIKTDLGITGPVKILNGVKQGDVLSALLFCIVITTVI